MTVCPLVLNYDIEDKNREHLENLKHDIEIQSNTIFNEIMKIHDSIDIVDDKVPAEDLAKIKEWATILSGSQDFRNLVKTTSIIKRLLTEIGDEVRYGSSDISDLAEKISKTETMAIELIRRENKKIPENIKNEIKNIMNDLDKIKKKLDEKRNSYILVISQDGKMFRDGASKEQMLINYIHGFS